MPDRPSSERPSLLARLALQRPEMRAWALYDWGNSAFFTTTVAAVFPVYFHKIATQHMSATEATATFADLTTFGLLLVAVAAPLLGAAADFRGSRKRWLAAFTLLGAGAAAGMYFVDAGQWQLGAALFIVGNIGASGSIIFYDALLPHVARPDEIDRLSTSAYALGYLGGGLLLAAQLIVIMNPTWFGLPESGTLAVRLVLASVAVWWVLFTIPLLRRVREPGPSLQDGEEHGHATLMVALRRLWQTARELRRYRHALLFLVAYLIYIDGIGTVFRMAAIYATELEFESTTVIGALLLTQFVGVPCAIGFGVLAGRIGPKRSILIALVVYVVACILGSQMRTVGHLYALAGMIALVQGGTQALSRSLFASMIPHDRSAQFFGLFSVVEKVGAIAGPFVFARAISITGDSRIAVATIIPFFVIGGVLLLFVNVNAGRDAARAAA